VAGEAVWREATGNGFALDIIRDPTALLGYRLNGIGAGTFTTVMLATMEAAAQVASPEAFLVNDLTAVWSAASERVESMAVPARKSAGPRHEGRPLAPPRRLGPQPTLSVCLARSLARLAALGANAMNDGSIRLIASH